MEGLQAEDLSQVFARYNSYPGDDPGGVGTAPGSGFAVKGLTPRASDTDGMVGSVVFPGSVAAFVLPGALSTHQLREDTIDPLLGMPRDLNNDGVIDALDHADDYRILPVRVRLDWRGPGGGSAFEVRTILAGL